MTQFVAPPAVWPGQVTLARLAGVLSLFGLLVILGVTGLLAWREWERLLRDAGAQAEAAAFHLADHAGRLFEVADVALDATAALVDGRSWDELERDEDLHRQLRAIGRALPHVEDLWLNDAAGRLRLTGFAFPAPASDAADRFAFRQTMRPGRGLNVGAPIVGRVTGRPTFVVGKRLEGPGGTFRGMVSATADLAYFGDYWRRLSPAYPAHVALLREDTREVLAEHPSAGLSPVPAREIGAERAVGGLPLRLYVAFDRDAVVAAWYRWLRVHLPLGAGALLALAALSGLAFRQARREARVAAALAGTRAELAASNARLRAEMDERERAEAALRQAQKMEAVGRLTGGVAHDFNNLLTAVMGNLELLARRTDGDAHRLAMAAHRAAERGARLTASLLAFSRTQALRPEPLDVAASVRASLLLVRRVVGESVSLALRCEPGLAPARADAAQLEAAVLNLAINARDAMPDGGALTVRVSSAVLDARALAGNDDASPGAFVALELRDTGTGMTPEVLARCLDPFFTTKEVGKGTGLGLSQVYGSVRQLGGHVTIRSAPGRGTAVTLYLPVAEAPAPTQAGPARPEGAAVAVARGGAFAGASVLVAEDDADVRELAADALREAGCRVIPAADGAAALAVLARAEVRVDALFTDFAMPGGMNGVELCRRALALRPGLPVLLTTGYADPAGPSLGGAEGIPALSKPYGRADLLERLREVLAAKPAARERVPATASAP